MPISPKESFFEENRELILTQSSQILSDFFQQPISASLKDKLVSEPNERSLILRLALVSPKLNHPPTAIVKFSNLQSKQQLFEWIGYDYILAQGSIAHLFPDFYGGNHQRELLLLEDMGDSQNKQLGPILYGNDLELALEALQAFQSKLGELHGQTSEDYHQFQKICHQYPDKTLSSHKVHTLPSTLEEVLSIFKDNDISIYPEIEMELQTIKKDLQTPGPFHCFTHGDCTPANIFFDKQEGLKFYDLETCGFRHAFIDGSFSSMKYIYTVWGHQIPAEILDHLLQSYRTALSQYLPIATEDKIFNQALMTGTTLWLTALLTFLPSLQDKDKRWGGTTLRQRIIAGLDSYQKWVKKTNMYQYLGQGFETLSHKLKSKWPIEDTQLPFYPVFQQNYSELQ